MSSKVKVLQIGGGLMGENWISHLLLNNNVEVVGLVDVDENRLELLQSRYNLNKTYTDIIKAVSENKPDIIIDVTPPFLREKIVELAIEFKCNILAEKPLSISIESGRKIVELVHKSGITYMVNQNYRWNPALDLIRQNIKSIGKIKSIDCTFVKNVNLEGFRKNIDYPFISDQAVHHFDLCRYIISQTPESVFAVSINGEEELNNKGMGCTSIFKFSDDIVFNYSGTWNAIGYETSWSGNWIIFGTDGVITWNGEKLIKKFTKNTNGSISSKTITDQKTIEYDYEMCFDKSINHLIESINKKIDPMNSPKDNILTLLMAESAIISSKNNNITII
jgi:predicted dehydrogenase